MEEDSIRPLRWWVQISVSEVPRGRQLQDDWRQTAGASRGWRPARGPAKGQWELGCLSRGPPSG